MRAWILLPTLAGIISACGIEYGGPGSAPDGGMMDAIEDRGTGMTDSGAPCTCVPTPPAGWKFVALEVDGTDACPAEYGMHTFVVEGTAPPAKCTCQCDSAANQGSCTATSVTVQIGTGGNCTGASGTANMINKGCADITDVDGQMGQITWIKGTAVMTPTKGSCGAGTVDKFLPSITNPHTDVRCTLTGLTGLGCPATDTCVPNVSGAFKMCIESEMGPCPKGWTDRHEIGVGRTDTRDCPNACTCTPMTTCSAKGTSHKDKTCSDTNNFTFDLDGTCVNSNIHGLQTHSLEVTTKATTTCMGSAMPTGVSKLDNPTVVCCR